MPPPSDGDGKRTVGCSLSKLIITDAHLQKIRDAVLSTHKATLLVSELLNIYIRHSLESNSMVDLSHVFNQSWILNAGRRHARGGRRQVRGGQPSRGAGGAGGGGGGAEGGGAVGGGGGGRRGLPEGGGARRLHPLTPPYAPLPP